MKIKNGFTITNLILTLVIAGAVGIFGFQIGLGYMNKSTLQASVRAVLLDAKSSDSATPSGIVRDIKSRVSLNDTLKIADEDIQVSRTSDGFEVSVYYIKEVNITSNMKLVMDLGFTEFTP